MDYTTSRVCVACLLLRRGVKTRTAPAHTCARANPKYVEPERRGERVKVLYSTVKAKTYSAHLYVLTAQWLNGHRVKRGTEIWIPLEKGICFETAHQTARPEKAVWVDEEFYYNLAFVN